MPSRSNQTRRVIVALDGPASSGKSSVGAAAAEQLQLRFVDTGLFYRAVTALALLEDVPLDDAAGLVALVSRVTLGDDGTGRLTRVLLDGLDATDEARSATVDGYVSAVARVPEVREALLERQRELAAAGGIVVAGRDIGTVVLPDADLKLFLDASVEERAKRRIEERGLDPDGDEAEEVREQLRIRDAIDTGRAVAPLRAADDAVHVVTDGNVFDDTVEIVAAEIARVMLTPRKTTRSRSKASPSRTAAAAAAAAKAMDAEAAAETAAAPEAGLGAVVPSEPAVVPTDAEAAPEAAPVPVDPGPFASTVSAPPAAGVANAVAGPFAVSSDVEIARPEVAAVPVPVDPGPFAVGVTASAGAIAHPVVGAFAVASDVEVVLPEPEPEAQPVPVDPGPFAVAAGLASAPVAHPIAGPFAVSTGVEVVLPPPPPQATPVEPGPFAADAAAGSDPVAHPVMGPFAVSTQVDVTLPPVAVEPEPVDPGPFAVGVAASPDAITHPVVGAFAVASDIEVVLPEPMPEPAPVDPGPFAVQAAAGEGIAHAVVGPFAVSDQVDVTLPAMSPAPEPEPVDPGPFAVIAAVASAPVAHPVAGSFAVSSEVQIERAEPAPPAVDPGPFGLAAMTAGGPVRHPALGAFAVSSAVEHEHPPLHAPEPEPEPALAPEPQAAAEPEPEPAPAPGPEAGPTPEPAPVAAAAVAAHQPATHARSSILETAMRLDNDQTMLVRMVALVSRIGARAVANVKVEGLDNIPRKGAVILAINHISNADAVVSGAWISESLKRRRIHWLGKKELFEWPVFGWLAANGGVHPVDRDSADIEAFRLATRILEQGYVLLVFPEGTRSPTGQLQEAKDGAAMLALRTGAQVVPVGISNTDAVWRKGQLLPNPFPRRTVRVRIGKPFRVQDVIPEGTDRRSAKALATRAIMGRIAELLDRRHRGVYADAIREGHAVES
ncbi:MAG TPA: (d)CMP kinase [Candidatus Limnocylindrales bacterium]|nr:(d)CMP kinase [Candidatus Limnocylindrales bacterium]